MASRESLWWRVFIARNLTEVHVGLTFQAMETIYRIPHPGLDMEPSATDYVVSTRHKPVSPYWTPACPLPTFKDSTHTQQTYDNARPVINSNNSGFPSALSSFFFFPENSSRSYRYACLGHRGAMPTLLVYCCYLTPNVRRGGARFGIFFKIPRRILDTLLRSQRLYAQEKYTCNSQLSVQQCVGRMSVSLVTEIIIIIRGF